ncbi:hypothetical protein [Euzebya tangerina]|uniref:hypothetical protein n=1 Tax=Euzebya tangerina TaxID=591198 RepID=UPI0013C2D9FE|nr:hypothetical protein [Euzebya tangerina]
MNDARHQQLMFATYVAFGFIGSLIIAWIMLDSALSALGIAAIVGLGCGVGYAIGRLVIDGPSKGARDG